MSIRRIENIGHSQPSKRKIAIKSLSPESNILGNGNVATLIRLLKGRIISNVVVDTDMTVVELILSNGTILSFYDEAPSPTIACFQ